jgi:flagellar motor protein MotB
MRSVRIAAVAGALLMCTAMVGCRNRVAEERDELWRQSRGQQDELDRKNAELEAMRKAQAQKTAATPPPAPAAVTPAPMPAPPPQPVTPIAGLETSSDPSAGTVTVNLPGDIFFNSGEATIRTPAQDSLKKVAATLKKDKAYAGKPIRVEGHTDSDPIKKSKWKSNQELSEARAKSVKDYLAKQGIDSGLMTAVGHGADMPRGADKSRNRRVEVVVLVDAAAAAAHKASAPKPAAVAPVDKPELNK